MCGCEKVLPRLLVLKWDIAHMSATALKKRIEWSLYDNLFDELNILQCLNILT